MGVIARASRSARRACYPAPVSIYRTAPPGGPTGHLPCPSCGAPGRADAFQCVGCGVRLATLRCSDCFHLNRADEPHCRGCGHELGLEPILEASPLRCPGCRGAMSVFRSDGAALHECNDCGGQFVERAMVVAHIRRRLSEPEFGRQPAALAAETQPIRYLVCPACGAPMIRVNYGRVSGIVVDACRLHGFWMDRGELPRLVTFTISGALDPLRQRDSSDRRRSESQARTLDRARESRRAATGQFWGAEPAIWNADPTGHQFVQVPPEPTFALDLALGLLDEARRDPPES